jgi:predicted RNase H-like nuclease
MFVAGVDGCRAGWVCFKVEATSLATSVEVIDLPELLKNRPNDLACLGIDIPIGLLNGPRACDTAARKLLKQPRGRSVFSAPCRASLLATTYANANRINREKTESGLSQQSYCIGPKIKQVDDAITPDCQKWAFEVHPEVCFWALNQQSPMKHSKKTEEGRNTRLELLSPVFPGIGHLLADRPSGVAKDDLLDAAAAAWTALRLHKSDALNVCQPESDERGLAVTICY